MYLNKLNYGNRFSSIFRFSDEKRDDKESAQEQKQEETKTPEKEENKETENKEDKPDKDRETYEWFNEKLGGLGFAMNEKDEKRAKELKKAKKKWTKFLKNNYYSIIFSIGGSILFYLAYLKEKHRENKKETFNRLSLDLSNKRVKEVRIYKHDISETNSVFEAKAFLIDGESYIVNIEYPEELCEKLHNLNIPYRLYDINTSIYYYLTSSSNNASSYILNILMIFLPFILYKQISGVRNIFKKASFNMINPLTIKKRFKDVAGVDEAKKEIWEYVDFLKNPKRYTDMGAKIPRGAILVGPPGTGKTLLAKACAAEAGVPYFYISGSEFVEGYVGVGAKKIRELFAEANLYSPSIIFIDEIEAVGKKRGNSVQEIDNTLNQLLVEMDGFKTDKSVIVFGATNRPDDLDDALKRPGRFDRQIEFTLPDKAARKQILEVHLERIRLDTKQGLDWQNDLANITPGFSGADLENLTNEAAILAGREQSNYVNYSHFEQALERIQGGIKTFKVIPQEKKHRLAVYEAGKAVASWFLSSVTPVLKISLVPRSKKSTGYAQYLTQDRNLQTTNDLIEKIGSLIAGKMSEELVLDECSTAGERDLKQAYDICQKMVTKFGMSDEIGLVHLKDDDYKSYSDFTNELTDLEIDKIVGKAESLVRQILTTHIDKVTALAEQLVDKETLNHKELIAILGERPFDDSKSYKEYKENINLLQ